MSEAAWQARLPSPANSRTKLRAALFTTYDQPDERLLVEHLMPSLLALRRSAEGDGASRNMFFGDLVRRLRLLSGRLAIIISPSVTKNASLESSAYPWLWNHIHKLRVGMNDDAVQHAKLWFFHWSDEDTETLEIRLSSANLTMGAFRDQLQAGWQTLVPLQATSASNLRSWGVLPTFLEALAHSTGERSLLEYFSRLLARSVCPEGATFLASVPGRHSPAVLRKTPWGSAGLRDLSLDGRGRTQIRVTVPYVGTWSPDELGHWCEQAGAASVDLNLVWLDPNHPWVRLRPNWAMPATTLASLRKTGSKLLQLLKTSRFHEKHRVENDKRWGHAKLYHLKRGRSERLLLTSANFSAAAWGRVSAGALSIQNFELGVAIEGGKWPLEELGIFSEDARVFAFEPAPRDAGNEIVWADASWDGRVVQVRCRARTESTLNVTVIARANTASTTPFPMDQDATFFVASIGWTDKLNPPTSAVFSSAADSQNCEVRDVRPADQQTTTPFPEVDPAVAQAVADQLLLEAYGARIVMDDEPIDAVLGSTAVPAELHMDDDVASRADYGVPALEVARELFRLADCWADRLRRAQRDSDRERSVALLLGDGQELVSVLKRRAAAEQRGSLARAAVVVAEEVGVRLEQLQQCLGASRD